MAEFTGTPANESITPGGVSSTVMATPAGSTPSDAADIIVGGGGTDIISGGGGADIISFSDAGTIAHGDAGDDRVTYDVATASGIVSGIISGDEGNDGIGFDTGHEDGSYKLSGEVRFFGGSGNDTISGTGGFHDIMDLTVYMYGDAGIDTLRRHKIGQPQIL